MIEGGTRPRLAAKARLRVDRQTGGQVLLAPEKGLALNPTGSAILELCDGVATVAEIAAALAAKYAWEVGVIEGEVIGFLQQLADRGLIEAIEAAP